MDSKKNVCSKACTRLFKDYGTDDYMAMLSGLVESCEN